MLLSSGRAGNSNSTRHKKRWPKVVRPTRSPWSTWLWVSPWVPWALHRMLEVPNGSSSLPPAPPSHQPNSHCMHQLSVALVLGVNPSPILLTFCGFTPLRRKRAIFLWNISIGWLQRSTLTKSKKSWPARRSTSGVLLQWSADLGGFQGQNSLFWPKNRWLLG